GAQLQNGEEEGAEAPGSAPLKLPGLAHAVTLAHHQGEIEAGAVYQQSLEDVPAPAQMQASHAARLVHVRETLLRKLRAFAVKHLAPPPAEPTTIGIEPPLLGFLVLALPHPPAAFRLGDVAPHAVFLDPREHLIAVVALVRHPLLYARSARFTISRNGAGTA